MKYLKTFESYDFEDFTHADMEDVNDLLEEGLTAEEIAELPEPKMPIEEES